MSGRLKPAASISENPPAEDPTRIFQYCQTKSLEYTLASDKFPIASEGYESNSVLETKWETAAKQAFDRMYAKMTKGMRPFERSELCFSNSQFYSRACDAIELKTPQDTRAMTWGSNVDLCKKWKGKFKVEYEIITGKKYDAP